MDSLLKLKIETVEAGILTRTKEKESWEYYRTQIDENPKSTLICNLALRECGGTGGIGNNKCSKCFGNGVLLKK